MVNSVRISELLNAFASATRKDWEKAAAKEINDNHPDEKLSWQGPENLSFLPYYDDGISNISILRPFQLTSSPHEQNNPRTWLNLPMVTVENEKYANEKIRRHLECGADGVFLRFSGKQFDFNRLFDSIDLTAKYFSIQLAKGDDSAHHLADFMRSHRNGSHPQIKGKIFSDPVLDSSERLLHSFSVLKNFSPIGLFIASNPNPVHEIKDALVKAVTMVDQLTEKGIGAEDIINKICFSLEGGTHFFYTISKLKALRVLWFQVVRAYNCVSYQHTDLHIHVRSEVFSKEAFDPHANMLKATITSLAAVTGGCDALTVFPENENNDMMDRVSRNISVILKEESHMHRVADPTAGAWFLDKMTQAFAASAWKEFQTEIKLK